MNGQQQFNRIELDRLVYSLMLSDNQCVILLKSLKEKDMLKESVDMHHDEIKQFLQVDDHTKRIKNVNTVFRLLQYDIDPSRWTFDIAYYQSCKRLYCYLDDKHKKYESVVFMESQGVADPFEFLKQALEEARYEEFKWKLNGDFSKVSVARRSFRITSLSNNPPDSTRLTDLHSLSNRNFRITSRTITARRSPVRTRAAMGKRRARKSCRQMACLEKCMKTQTRAQPSSTRSNWTGWFEV